MYLALVVVATLVFSVEGCDVLGYEQCAAEFLAKHPESSNNLNPTYNEQQLVSICTDFDDSKSCITPKVEGCSEEKVIQWQIMVNFFDYLCSDDTKSLLRDQTTVECWNSAKLTSDIKSCNTTMHNKMNRIRNDGGTAEELCTVMETYGSCSVGSARELCGEESARWYGKLVDVIFAPSKKAANCDFNAGTSTATFSTLLLVFALFLHNAVSY